MKHILIIFLLPFSFLANSILAQSAYKSSSGDHRRLFIAKHDSTDLPPKIIVSDLYHDFGEVPINNSHEWEFSINSTVTDTLIIYDIENRNPYFIVNKTTGSIPGNASQQITITFNPKEIGLHHDTVIILTHDQSDSMYEIHLSGCGVLPAQEELPVTIFPNPFTPNNDGFNDYVEFRFSENYTMKPHIQIFNLRGKQVFELDEYPINMCRWYGKDKNGNDVEPGLYIYILRHENNPISNGIITLVR